MILNETFALADGVAIPKLGLGTWRIDDEAVEQVVREAASIGYRHFDTAQAYGNERGVGEGLRASGVSRADLFVTTKLVAESKSYADAKGRIDGSLQALGLDHIDLMLIQSPQPWAEFREGGNFDAGNLEAWRALEEAQQAGKLRAIGVSNFERADLDNILEHGTVNPVVNYGLEDDQLVFLADADNAHRELRRNPAVRRRVDEAMRRLQRRAIEMIELHSAQVEAIAQALLRRRFLSSEEVGNILVRTRGAAVPEIGGKPSL